MKRIKNTLLWVIVWLLLTIFSWTYADLHATEIIENNNFEHITTHHSWWHWNHIERDEAKETRVNENDFEDLLKKHLK